MTQLRDYHAWSIAAIQFAASPDALTQDQQEQLARDVDRAITIEAAILASSEASCVSIPMDQQKNEAASWQTRHPSSDLPESSIMNGIKRELMVQAVLDGVAARADMPTETEAKAFYLEDPQRFALPERRTVRHILASVAPDASVQDERKVKVRIDRLLAALKSGEAFADLATQYSDCPTARSGGLVGTVAEGSLYPEVDAAAFALTEGEWSGPVRTDLGWHLVMCETIFPAEPALFEILGPKILEHLQQQARRAAQVEWLQQLSNQSAA